MGLNLLLRRDKMERRRIVRNKKRKFLNAHPNWTPYHIQLKNKKVKTK